MVCVVGKGGVLCLVVWCALVCSFFGVCVCMVV